MTLQPSSESLPPSGQIVQLDRIEMYYEEYGTGNPLVLLHGFGGCAKNWHPYIDELSQQHRLIVVDLPGHGQSTDPENKFTHLEAANEVFRLLDNLGIDRFSALGISSGGMILLHMATRQTNRIESMVLISATTHFPDQARAIMRRASYDTLPKSVKEMYQLCAPRGEGQIRQLISQFNAFSDDHDDMNFSPECLSVISARTLVVHGDRDQFFPIEIPVSIYNAITDAELWIIPGGSHVPIDDPEIAFAATVLRFLGRRTKSPFAPRK